MGGIKTEVCYQCNSAIDSDCGSSNADVLMKFKKKCEPEMEDPPKKLTPVACRKVNQHLSSNPVRVIRECAYSEDPHLNGMRKQGSKGIYMLYYQCENTDNDTPCNECSRDLLSLTGLVAMFGFLWIMRM